MINPKPRQVMSRAIIDDIGKEPRLVQIIQAHNEEGLIEPVLRSIYNEVDYILVIEGAVVNRPNRTDDGHSTDTTRDKIFRFIAEEDPDDKVVLIEKDRPYVDLEEIKNTFLRYVRDGDWLIINDCDEFYRPEDIRRIRELIYIYPHAREFVPLFLHFYRDSKHIIKPDAENQPQHQRIVKFVKGMHYRSHPVLTYGNGLCSYFGPDVVQSTRLILSDMYIWHYGFVKTEEEIRIKAEFYTKELEKHQDRGVEAHNEKTENFLNHTEDLARIAYYDGEHPAGIQRHPILDLVESTYVDKTFDHWKSVEPYSLPNVPQCWVLATQGRWSREGNWVHQ